MHEAPRLDMNADDQTRKLLPANAPETCRAKRNV